jgi:hypothetical protein
LLAVPLNCSGTSTLRSNSIDASKQGSAHTATFPASAQQLQIALPLRLIAVSARLPVLLVSNPELSPLDLTIAPNGNIVVSSEPPFGALDAVTSVREYDAQSGGKAVHRFISIYRLINQGAFSRTVAHRRVDRRCS